MLDLMYTAKDPYGNEADIAIHGNPAGFEEYKVNKGTTLG